MSGLNSKLSEAWVTKDLWIEYNGCDIKEESFVDIEILFGGHKTIGKCIFLDNEAFTSGLRKGTTLDQGGLMKIGWVDCTGCNFEIEMAVTSTKHELDKKQQKLVEVQLVDMESRNMKGSFISKGYPDTTYSEAMEKHLKEMEISSIIVVPPEDEKKANIVIPSHVSFFDTLVQTSKDKDYSYKTDKDFKYLVHNSHTSFDKLKETQEHFEYDAKQLQVNRILQYSVKGYDVDAFLESVPTRTTSMDAQSSNSKDNDKGLDTKEFTQDASEVKTKTQNTKAKDMVATRGVRIKNKPHQDKEYFNAISNAQGLSIWVPGRNISRIGKKVQVSLPRPKFYSGTENDEVFEGHWEVVFTRDKLIGQYFVQELVLRRPGK